MIFDHLNDIISNEHQFLSGNLTTLTSLIGSISKVLENAVTKVNVQFMMGSSRNASRKASADFHSQKGHWYSTITSTKIG
jgi:hypothetical protein